MYLDNIRYNRFERQKEVLLLLNGNWLSVRDLSEYLNIDVKHSDFLLRHYHKNHYLKRNKIEGKFQYTITNWGLKQLNEFLESGKYKDYDNSVNRVKPLSRLEKAKNDFLEIVELKNKLK